MYGCDSRLILISRLINRSSMVYIEPVHIKKPMINYTANKSLTNQYCYNLAIPH